MGGAKNFGCVAKGANNFGRFFFLWGGDLGRVLKGG